MSIIKRICYLLLVIITLATPLAGLLTSEKAQAATTETLYYVASATIGDLEVCNVSNPNTSTSNSIICYIGTNPDSTPGALVNSNYSFNNNSLPSGQNVITDACSTNASTGYVENSDGTGKTTVTVANFASASKILTNDGYGTSIICSSKTPVPSGPEPVSDQVINVNITYNGLSSATVTGGGNDTLGPITINLCSGGSTTCSAPIQTVQSDSTTISQSTITLTAKLTGVTPPGKFTVCASNIAIKPCQIVTKIKDQTLLVSFIGTGSDAAAITGSPGSSNGSNTPSCDNSGTSLSWIICPIINAMVNGVQDIFNHIIKPELQINPIITSPSATGCSPNTDPTCDPTHSYDIWTNFRLYGNIVLVIALLGLVFAEILGGGVIDAYTLKKMLPRILVAAVLINLSIYIVAVMVDISNVIGGGITNLIVYPFKAAGANVITLSSLSDFLIGGGVAAGIWGLSILGATVIPFLLLFLLLPAFVSILGVVLTILLRQALLVLLVVSAPVAFALYCLPNTEQYFKKWWNLLFKTLLIYPIISIFFALSTALSVTMNSAGGNDPLSQILSVIALFVPLFMIPFAFKIAGGVLGAANGAINNVGKKVTERIKGDPRNQESLRNKINRGMGERATAYQGKWVERGRADVDKDAKLRTKLGKGVGILADNLGGNYDGRMAKYKEAAAKRAETITTYGNDDLVYAGAGYMLKPGETDMNGEIVTDKDGKPVTGNTYFNSKGKQIDQQLYKRGKSLFGGNQSDVGQSLSYTAMKAQTDKDSKAVGFAFIKNAEDGDWTEGQLKGVHAGMTVPYKGRSLFQKWETPEKDKDTGKVTITRVTEPDNQRADDAYNNAIKQPHNGGPAYKLSEISAKDWQDMATKQRQLESRIESGNYTEQDKQSLAMTHEVFDAATQKIRTGDPEEIRDEGGHITIAAGGVSPAAAAIIEQSVKNRHFDTKVSQRGQDAGNNEKELVSRQALESPVENPYTFTTGPTVT